MSLIKKEDAGFEEIRIAFEKPYSKLEHAKRRGDENIDLLVNNCADAVLNVSTIERIVESLRDDKARSGAGYYINAAFALINSSNYHEKIVEIISEKGYEVSALNCFLSLMNFHGGGVNAIPFSYNFCGFMAETIDKNQGRMHELIKPTSENPRSATLFQVFVDNAKDPIALLESMKPDELMEFISVMGKRFDYDDFANANPYNSEGGFDVSREASERLFSFVSNIKKDPFISQLYYMDMLHTRRDHVFIKLSDLPSYVTDIAVPIIKYLLESHGHDISKYTQDDLDLRLRASEAVSRINALVGSEGLNLRQPLTQVIIDTYRTDSKLSLLDNFEKSESSQLLSSGTIDMSDLNNMKKAFGHHKIERLNSDLGL